MSALYIAIAIGVCIMAMMTIVFVRESLEKAEEQKQLRMTRLRNKAKKIESAYEGYPASHMPRPLRKALLSEIMRTALQGLKLDSSDERFKRQVVYAQEQEKVVEGTEMNQFPPINDPQTAHALVQGCNQMGNFLSNQAQKGHISSVAYQDIAQHLKRQKFWAQYYKVRHAAESANANGSLETAVYHYESALQLLRENNRNGENTHEINKIKPALENAKARFENTQTVGTSAANPPTPPSA